MAQLVTIATALMICAVARGSFLGEETVRPRRGCNATQITCQDRCGSTPGKDMGGYFCNCDNSKCKIYGDCCADIDEICADVIDNDLPSELIEQANSDECTEVNVDYGVYAKARCRDSSNVDSNLRNACENPKQTNLLFLTPVIDTTSGSTYKNIFCAKCNEVHENIVFWKPKIKCVAGEGNQMLLRDLQITEISDDALWELAITYPDLCRVDFSLDDGYPHPRPCILDDITNCTKVEVIDLEVPTGLNMLNFDILVQWGGEGKIQVSMKNISGILGEWNRVESECRIEDVGSLGCDSTSCCDVTSCPEFHVLKDGRCVYNELLVKVQYEMNLLVSLSTFSMVGDRFQYEEMMNSFDAILPTYGFKDREGYCEEKISFGISRIQCDFVCSVTFKVPCQWSIPHGSQPERCLKNTTQVKQVIDGALEHTDANFLEGVVGIVKTNWSIIDISDRSQNSDGIDFSNGKGGVSGDTPQTNSQCWVFLLGMLLYMIVQ